MPDKMSEINSDVGYLKMKSEADRVEVATLLFKSGYAVKTVRCKVNGRYEYFVKYEKPEKEGD